MNRQKLFLTFLGTGMSAHPIPTACAAAGIFGTAILCLMGDETLFLIALSTTVIGIFEINKFEKFGGAHDDRTVVIDKAAGMWLAISIASRGAAKGGYSFDLPVGIIIAAAAFAVFIYWKPSTVGWIDRSLKGGAGKMLDDTLSGIAAALLSLVLIRTADFVFPKF